MNRKLTFIRVFFLLCLVICYLPLSSLAANKVVVIPLFGHGKTLKNVVTVAKSGGKFTDPVAAVNSITDASANNPYLVVIGPGVYTLTQTLVMKPWVDVTGSGENVTKLVGAISGKSSANSAIVQTAGSTVLSDLRVENSGVGDYSIGIRIANGAATLCRITAKAVDGSISRGIEVSHASAVLNEVTALAGFGHENIAIANFYSPSLKMEQIVARATGGASSFNIGIHLSNSNPIMVDVTAEAYGGMTNIGVRNYSASPQMFQVRVSAGAGANNYGVYNFNGSCAPEIRRSTIKGTTYGLYVLSTGRTYFSQSTINGGVYVSGTATAKCVACDGDYNPLGENCL